MFNLVASIAQHCTASELTNSPNSVMHIVKGLNESLLEYDDVISNYFLYIYHTLSLDTMFGSHGWETVRKHY